jgi:hypothetical protein
MRSRSQLFRAVERLASEWELTMNLSKSPGRQLTGVPPTDDDEDDDDEKAPETPPTEPPPLPVQDPPPEPKPPYVVA